MKTKSLLLFGLSMAIMLSCSQKKSVDLLPAESGLEGWVSILDTTSVETAIPTFYAEEGVLHISGVPKGYIRTDKKYSDYILTLDWRWAGEESVDGGIYVHLQDGDKVWPTGIQFQMTSADMGLFMSGIKLSDAEEAHPGFYKKPVLYENSPEKPVGEWNSVEIICKENHIKAYLNGILVNEADCDANEGYIGFQSEGGPMQIKNIRIK